MQKSRNSCDQPQRQNDSLYRCASPTAPSPRFNQKQQSNDCNAPAHRSQKNAADDDAETTDTIGLQIDSDDDSDCDYEEWLRRNGKKTSIAHYLMTFNDDNIHVGDLPSIELDKLIQPGHGFRLFLSQVHSPFKFWFQLNEHSEAIDSLMDRLE